MTPSLERHQRLRAVFEEALTLHVAARARHVREALSDDADLGARCLQLLHAHDSAESFLERPIGRTPFELTDDPFRGTDRFEVAGRVGAGGMGVVYAVNDRLRGEVVALKALRGTDAVDRYRLKREFRGLADVGHRNLVSLYELVVESEDCFLTMEFIDGVSFVDHVRALEGAPVDLARLMPALAQLVDGVDALHARGILHRDIKPSNILVTLDGRVVILDFGLIAERSLQASESIHETVGGTPAYVAPEVVDGAPSTEASDWYGVGVTLYEALTGHVPFDGSVADVLRRKRTEDPEPLRAVVPFGIPDELADVCMRLLSRRLEERVAGSTALRLLVAPAAGTDAGSAAPSRHAFVGRARELRVLDQVWEESRRGASVTVSIIGPSGIGKSALVREFLGRCGARGAPVILTGRCYENESVPHKALDGVVDDLSRHLASLPRSDVGDLLSADVSALTRVFPVMLQVGAIAEVARGEEPVTADPLVIRRRGFEALSTLLGRMAARRPLILWIDDLQWSDADSARVLEGLLSSAVRPAMLSVLSFRSEESAIKPFLQALLNRAGDDGWLSLVLEPLAEDEASTLLDDVVPARAALSADERNHLLQEAAGSPFVLEQLALHAGAPSAGTTAAPTLAGMLASRLTALPPQARAFVETLAVCGRPVALDLVCDACGIVRDRQSLVVSLRNAHLIRSSGSVDRVETYHDRVREALAVGLAEGETRGIHARMAGVLTARQSDDYEALYGHYRGAGDTSNAAIHAVRAGQKASAALAFDRAATLYAQALELTPQSSAVRLWQEGLASALANAGRPAEAAEAYLRVAEMSEVTTRIESQRRAAEQFLIGGHIDRGLGLIRDALDNVGLSSVATPRAALVRLVWRRARQWWRGYDFVERPESDDLETQLRLDTCWSAASGLALVDVVSASDFVAWHLRMALDAGDRVRIARGLALESAARSVDWIYRGSSARLAGQAKVLSQRIGSPQATATALLGEAMSAITTGQWRRALISADESLTILRDRCVGVRWELNMAQNMFLWALMYLGELGEVSRRLPALLADARRRGDLYLATELCTRVNLVWLVADEPDEGERETLAAIAQWSQQGFHRQHYSAMLARVQTALYRGDSESAWRLLQQHEAPLRASMLTRAQAIRVESNYLRGRCALATAARMSDGRLLGVARNSARRLAGERMHWATPLGMLLSAGIASTEGDAAQARRLLATAIEGFDRAEMQWYAAVARRRLGELLSGDEGQTLRDTAAAWMASQGIRNPAAITRMLAPGF